MGTIQFATALHGAASLLQEAGFTDVLVPQAKPLSPGETLGCTAPRLYDDNSAKQAAGGAGGCAAAASSSSSSSTQQLVPRQGVLVFVADGRFHLEAAMIANPQLDAYR
jgi:2-(3-amino-3-carboxypropyl)histidine synthase